MKKSLILLSSLFVLASANPVYATFNVEEVTEQREKDFKELEEVELFTGVWFGGTDIEPGRYVVTGEGSGNFFVRGEEHNTNEILLDTPGDNGVTSITIDINDGDEIEIMGLNRVWFTPHETELQESLSAGIWIVGIDIKEGNYIATTETGSGNFFVRGGSRTVNEILDSTAEYGVDKIAVSLEDGQEVQIMGLELVNFTER